MNSHILQVFTDKVALVDKLTWWLDSVGLFGILQRARNVRIAQFVETFVMTHCYLEHDNANPEYQLAHYMRNWLLLPGCQMKHLIVNDNYFTGEDGRSAGLKLCTAFVDEALLMPFCKPGGELLEEVVADAGFFSCLPCMKKDEVDENEMRALEGNGEHFSNPEVVADEGCCSFLPCMKKDENVQEEIEQDIALKQPFCLYPSEDPQPNHGCIELDLSHNGLRDHAGKQLARMLELNTDLLLVNLSKNKFRYKFEPYDDYSLITKPRHSDEFLLLVQNFQHMRSYASGYWNQRERKKLNPKAVCCQMKKAGKCDEEDPTVFLQQTLNNESCHVCLTYDTCKDSYHQLVLGRGDEELCWIRDCCMCSPKNFCDHNIDDLSTILSLQGEVQNNDKDLLPESPIDFKAGLSMAGLNRLSTRKQDCPVCNPDLFCRHGDGGNFIKKEKCPKCTPTNFCNHGYPRGSPRLLANCPRCSVRTSSTIMQHVSCEHRRNIKREVESMMERVAWISQRNENLEIEKQILLLQQELVPESEELKLINIRCNASEASQRTFGGQQERIVARVCVIRWQIILVKRQLQQRVFVDYNLLYLEHLTDALDEKFDPSNPESIQPRIRNGADNIEIMRVTEFSETMTQQASDTKDRIHAVYTDALRYQSAYTQSVSTKPECFCGYSGTQEQMDKHFAHRNNVNTLHHVLLQQSERLADPSVAHRDADWVHIRMILKQDLKKWNERTLKWQGFRRSLVRRKIMSKKLVNKLQNKFLEACKQAILSAEDLWWVDKTLLRLDNILNNLRAEITDRGWPKIQQWSEVGGGSAMDDLLYELDRVLGFEDGISLGTLHEGAMHALGAMLQVCSAMQTDQQSCCMRI